MAQYEDRWIDGSRYTAGWAAWIGRGSHNLPTCHHNKLRFFKQYQRQHFWNILSRRELSFRKVAVLQAIPTKIHLKHIVDQITLINQRHSQVVHLTGRACLINLFQRIILSRRQNRKRVIGRLVMQARKSIR